MGVQINEPQPFSKSFPCGMTQLDLELEKSRKERENLANELEKVENEAQAAEARRKIMFIKSNSAQTVQPTQLPFVLPPAPVVSAPTVAQSAPLFPPFTTPAVTTHFPSLQLPHQTHPPVQNQVMGASASAIPAFQRKPIHMERYK